MTEAWGSAMNHPRSRPERGSAPDPSECRSQADVGTIHHDEERDIWYECIFDPRRKVYTWTIEPPVE